MKINEYLVSYFSSVDWDTTTYKLLAFSEEQVREFVEKDTPSDCRGEPQFGLSRLQPPKDSLQITLLGELTLPYRIVL